MVKGAAPHCVQCQAEMPYGTDGDKFVPICNNPGCPCFGLLQMGIEQMSKVVPVDSPEDNEQYLKGLRQKVRDAGTWAGVDVQGFMDGVRGR